MRTAGVVVFVACGLALVGCSKASNAAGSASASSTTTTTSATGSPSIATPRMFAEPTFVETRRDGEVAIAPRVDDGKIVQILVPPAPNSKSARVQLALRAAPTELLAQLWVVPPAPGLPLRNETTGTTFPGELAHVSPDGRRVATLVVGAKRQQMIRQYDAATGRRVADLPVPDADGYMEVLGFNWATDGAQVIVALEPGLGRRSGLYLGLADTTMSFISRVFVAPEGMAFLNPAMLPNGHVVAVEALWPQERPPWPSTLVDIDLHAGTYRTVLGDPRLQADPVLFLNPNSPIDVRGGRALFTDGDGNTYVYDGKTARRVATGNADARW